MPIPTCTVTCAFRDAADQPRAGARVEATLTLLETADEAVVVPAPVAGTTDAQGVCVLTLFRNAAGQAGSRYRIRLTGTDGRTETMYAVVPDAAAARLDDILVDREFSAPPATVAGESAYQVAVRNGFVGTEAQWLDSLMGPPGPGVISDTNLTFTSPDNTTLRVGKVGSDGIARYVDLVMIEPPSLDAPTLESIEAYRTNTTTWTGIPYGSASWPEPGMGTLYQVVDIALPSGTAPAAGWPVIVYFHANSAVRTIAAGSSLDTNFKQVALSLGYAVAQVEFRHPVTNVNQGAPHTDAGLALQFVRSLHQALNLDRTRIHAFCRSRGSLALWQALQADMANSNAATYAGRQSSLLKSLWIIQGQIAYSTARFAELYIVPADRAALIAANPDNPAWKNAIDGVPTANSLPQVSMVHELPWYGAQVTAAQMTADGSQVHFPDAGRLMVAAYQARGLADRCAAWDNEPSTGDNIEQIGDAPYWFAYIDEGMSAIEALAMARARRKAMQAHYFSDDLSGAFQTAQPLAGAPVLGGPIGALACGQYGLANRSAPTPLGYGAAQLTAANRPILYQFATGHYGAGFDNTDRWAVAMPSDGVIEFRAWTDAGEVTTLISASTSNYVFGTTAFQDQKFVLDVAKDGAPLTPNDLKIFRRFASAWAGRAYP